MKKIFYLMMVLPFLLTACDEDDNDFDFPDVKIDVQISGAKIVKGTIYIVQGNVLDIESIKVVPANAKKQVLIGSVNYYWDRMFVGATALEPYSYSIDTGYVMTGKHLLQMKCSLLAVNYSPALGYLVYPVKVVESENDIPDGEMSTQFTVTPNIHD